MPSLLNNITLFFVSLHLLEMMIVCLTYLRGIHGGSCAPCPGQRADSRFIPESKISKATNLNLETSFPFATGTVIFSLNFNPQVTWSKPLKGKLLKINK